MAVRVRKQQQHIQQPTAPPIPQTPIKSRKKPNQKFEKLMLISLVCVIAVLAVFVLNNQAAIQTTSMDIQKVEAEVEEITRQNIGLTVRVSELSTYDSIWKKAKELGLTQHVQNVKVVPGE
ncbi:MAG: FtsL-like putative cell division protein [Lysinibacillus sp.]